MIYLDAAYDYSIGTDVIARFQSLLPRPSRDDQSSFEKLLRWRQKNLPGWNQACENDYRATRLKSGGKYTAQDSSPGTVQEEVIKSLILSGAPDFEKIRVPALAIFADHEVGRLLSRPEEEKNESANEVINAVVMWQKNQKELFKQRVEHSHVVTLTSTDHFCFIHKPDEVLGAMRKFLKVEVRGK